MKKIIKIKAGGIIIRDDGKFLAISRKSMGDLSLPKGHIEEYETHEQCALREVLEETGRDCEIDRYVGVINYDYILGDTQIGAIVHFYQMNPINYKPNNIITDEISSQTRLSFDQGDISRLSNLSDRSFISKYFDQIAKNELL